MSSQKVTKDDIVNGFASAMRLHSGMFLNNIRISIHGITKIFTDTSILAQLKNIYLSNVVFNWNII